MKSKKESEINMPDIYVLDKLSKSNGYKSKISLCLDSDITTDALFNSIFTDSQKNITLSYDNKKASYLVKNLRGKDFKDKDFTVAKNKFLELLDRDFKIQKRNEKTSNEIELQLRDMFFKKNDAKYFLHVGDTCSGKTYQAIEKLKKSEGKSLYLSPLRLLAHEVYEKLNSEVGCNLLTGEDEALNGSKNTASTIEMANYNTEHDIVVIDECIMLGDESRGKSWLKAILTIKAKEIHLILNREIESLVCDILKKTNKHFTKHEYKRLVPLTFMNKPIGLKKIEAGTVFIVFSRKEVLEYSMMFRNKGYKTSMLYGDLPPEVKKEQIAKFLSGENSVCVSTDVIGMGINLPCKTICFLKDEKYDGKQERKLKPFEVRQISGRAGRFGYHEEGFVTAIDPSMLKFLKKTYSNYTEHTKTYFSIDDRMIDLIDYPTLGDKLRFFNELNVIPNEISELVFKQPIDIYLRLLMISDGDKKVQDKVLLWKLINLPVKNNNEYLFVDLINCVSKNTALNFILDSDYQVNNQNDLKDAEAYVSKLDLYINAKRSLGIDSVFTLESKVLFANKSTVIKNINSFIESDLKMKKKTCVTCKKDVGLGWQHKECNACYNLKYSHSSDYDDDDYF